MSNSFDVRDEDRVVKARLNEQGLYLTNRTEAPAIPLNGARLFAAGGALMAINTAGQISPVIDAVPNAQQSGLLGWTGNGVAPAPVDNTIEIYDRRLATAGTTFTQGRTWLGYFQPKGNFPLAGITMMGTGTLTTPTLIRYGCYSCAGGANNGDLTQIAATVNDTALLAAAGTKYTKALAAPVVLTAGLWYTFAVNVQAASNPSALGLNGSFNAGMAADTPYLFRQVTGAVDLTPTITFASTTSVTQALYMRGEM